MPVTVGRRHFSITPLSSCLSVPLPRLPQATVSTDLFVTVAAILRLWDTYTQRFRSVIVLLAAIGNGLA